MQQPLWARLSAGRDIIEPEMVTYAVLSNSSGNASVSSPCGDCLEGLVISAEHSSFD